MWRLLMPDGALRRWTLVALGVLFVGLLAWPARIEAQIPSGVPGTGGTLTGIGGGTTTVLGGTGTLAAGSLNALYSEADSISTFLVSAEVPSARVIGYVDEIASDSYLASLNLTLAGITITAGSAEAAARAALDGSSRIATSYISNLTVNGLQITIDGTVNQTVPLPGGQVVINEQQILSDGTLVVNALHATVYGVADVVVASAVAGAGGGNAYAVQIKTP